jgi:hypothetical protein
LENCSLARSITWLATTPRGLAAVSAALLVAALLGTRHLLAADSTSAGGDGLIARAKQALTGGKNPSPVPAPVSGNGKLPLQAANGKNLDRQNPSKTIYGTAPEIRHWWKPHSKPAARTALDFWAQDSTTR